MMTCSERRYGFHIAVVLWFVLFSWTGRGMGTKEGFHVRSKHSNGYDFQLLTTAVPELKSYVFTNKYGTETIDFSATKSVKLLNKALLVAHYGVESWDIPESFLCPPVPSRADYVHHVADLLQSEGKSAVNKCKTEVYGLDIGVGANCIYPIVGITEYNWHFVGSDIDDESLQSAQSIIDHNPSMLKEKLRIRKQIDSNRIFDGIVRNKDQFDFCMANPPFHSSMATAVRGSKRKWRNLKNKDAIRDSSSDNGNKRGGKLKTSTPRLNFGGVASELYCDGGELGFISRMINESKDPFIHQRVRWFTTLVSNQDHLSVLYKLLDKPLDSNSSSSRLPQQVETIHMVHGNKRSRILAWKY